MPRQLTSADLLVTRIEGRNYAYIAPEIGEFRATRTIEDHSFSGSGQIGRLLLGRGDIYVDTATASSMQIGMKIFNDADVRVFNYQFRDTQSTNQFAVGIRVDENHTGSAELLRLYGNGLDDPSRPSPTINTDFLSLNNTNNSAGSVYMRDFTSRNFSDSGIDVKNDIFIMNATIEGAFRGLKLYDGATVTIVNSEIKSVPGGQQAMLFGTNAKVYYYNTTWDGRSTHDPNKIGLADVSPGQRDAIRRNNLIELDSNPLPRIDDFFTVDNDRYVAQVSVNNGPWIDLRLPNNGFLSTAIGDTLIELPNLGSGAYRLRAWTVEGSRSSAPVVSDGFTVGSGSTPTRTPSPILSDVDDPTRPPADDDRDPVAPDGDVTSGDRTPGGGFRLVAGRGDQVIVTSAGDDIVTTGWGEDLILFNTRADIGDDVITDLNRRADKLLFTEFVDFGADKVHRLDGSGRLNLNDRALDAAGGTIDLGDALAGRFVHFAGETKEGLFLYEVWGGSWESVL